MSSFSKAKLWFKNSEKSSDVEMPVNIAALYSHMLDKGYQGCVEITTYKKDIPISVYFLDMTKVKRIEFEY